jgi:hypothetical protein
MDDLQSVTDRLAIYELEARYCRTLNTKDWAMQDRVIFGPNRPSITGYGHYHERYVRQNGQWKIAALKLTRLHIDVHQSSAP